MPSFETKEGVVSDFAMDSHDDAAFIIYDGTFITLPIQFKDIHKAFNQLNDRANSHIKNLLRNSGMKLADIKQVVKANLEVMCKAYHLECMRRDPEENSEGTTTCGVYMEITDTMAKAIGWVDQPDEDEPYDPIMDKQEPGTGIWVFHLHVAMALKLKIIEQDNTNGYLILKKISNDDGKVRVMVAGITPSK